MLTVGIQGILGKPLIAPFYEFYVCNAVLSVRISERQAFAGY